MNRVLVTGGAGFLGSHLCQLLLGRGSDVVCIDNVAAKVEALRQGVVPIDEPGLEELIRLRLGGIVERVVRPHRQEDEKAHLGCQRAE